MRSLVMALAVLALSCDGESRRVRPYPARVGDAVVVDPSTASFGDAWIVGSAGKDGTTMIVTTSRLSRGYRGFAYVIDATGAVVVGPVAVDPRLLPDDPRGYRLHAVATADGFAIVSTLGFVEWIARTGAVSVAPAPTYQTVLHASAGKGGLIVFHQECAAVSACELRRDELTAAGATVTEKLAEWTRTTTFDRRFGVGFDERGGVLIRVDIEPIVGPFDSYPAAVVDLDVAGRPVGAYREGLSIPRHRPSDVLFDAFRFQDVRRLGDGFIAIALQESPSPVGWETPVNVLQVTATSLTELATRKGTVVGLTATAAGATLGFRTYVVDGDFLLDVSSKGTTSRRPMSSRTDALVDDGVGGRLFTLHDASEAAILSTSSASDPEAWKETAQIPGATPTHGLVRNGDESVLFTNHEESATAFLTVLDGTGHPRTRTPAKLKRLLGPGPNGYLADVFSGIASVDGAGAVRWKVSQSVTSAVWTGQLTLSIADWTQLVRIADDGSVINSETVDYGQLCRSDDGSVLFIAAGARVLSAKGEWLTAPTELGNHIEGYLSRCSSCGPSCWILLGLDYGHGVDVSRVTAKNNKLSVTKLRSVAIPAGLKTTVAATSDRVLVAFPDPNAGQVTMATIALEDPSVEFPLQSVTDWNGVGVPQLTALAGNRFWLTYAAGSRADGEPIVLRTIESP